MAKITDNYFSFDKDSITPEDIFKILIIKNFKYCDTLDKPVYVNDYDFWFNNNITNKQHHNMISFNNNHSEYHSEYYYNNNYNKYNYNKILNIYNDKVSYQYVDRSYRTPIVFNTHKFINRSDKDLNNDSYDIINKISKCSDYKNCLIKMLDFINNNCNVNYTGNTNVLIYDNFLEIEDILENKYKIKGEFNDFLSQFKNIITVILNIKNKQILNLKVNNYFNFKKYNTNYVYATMFGMNIVSINNTSIDNLENNALLKTIIFPIIDKFENGDYAKFFKSTSKKILIETIKK